MGQVVEVAAVEDEVEHLGVAVSVVRAHDVLGCVRPPDAVPVLAAVVLVREVAGTCMALVRSTAALGAGNDVWSTLAQYCCPLQVTCLLAVDGRGDAAVLGGGLGGGWGRAVHVAVRAGPRPALHVVGEGAPEVAVIELLVVLALLTRDT